MRLNNKNASILIPDGMDHSKAFKRITHLGIGAHQDDLEIMAFHGIHACLNKSDIWFGGITCTNGCGTVRSSKFASLQDDEICRIRRREQEKAASIGHYGMMVQLDYPSTALKDPAHSSLKKDLFTLISETKPDIIYTHNPADKHETHVGVVMNVIHAIRTLPGNQRPETIYGVEVWRSLDWMPDKKKVLLDVGGSKRFANQLIKTFVSQIDGGKRIDLATIGRRHVNATFFQPNQADETDQISYAMDLTPLIRDDSLDIVDYVLEYIETFQQDVKSMLIRYQSCLDP